MPDPKSIRVCHFADAHIDIANFGRLDPESALPVRVVDFLKALDQIVDAAIAEPVDLVIFAGDAYKGRNPQPTFQREWGRRMMRLSQAGIPTVMLVGNHDVSPASGRAHTLQEFTTLQVPNVHVADRIARLGPAELGRPVQVITVPWVSRSRLLAREEMLDKSMESIMALMEEKIAERIIQLIESSDPQLPLILTAHASIQGATYGSERAVMLGNEMVLSGQIVNDKRLDYVALGHIHKHQVLSAAGSQPVIVYPGSIERIDFGEVRERKGYVMADVARGKTNWRFVQLDTRRFVDIKIDTPDGDTFMEDVRRQLPEPTSVVGAICRVQLSYPRDWEARLDERVVVDHFQEALSLHIQKHRQVENRARLGDTVAVESMTPVDLLGKYWQLQGLDEAETAAMQTLAKEILSSVEA